MRTLPNWVWKLRDWLLLAIVVFFLLALVFAGGTGGHYWD